MSWWSLLPAMAAMALLVVVPGAAALRFLGVRGLVAIGAGAPVTMGLLGVAAVAFAPIGVPWRLAPVLLALLSAVTIAGLLGRWLNVWRSDGSRLLRGRGLAAVALSLIAGFAVLSLPLVTTLPAPDAPLQQWDGVFHLNAVVAIRETAVATPLGGLAPLYGAGTLAPYYPTGWHALLAITPFASSVPALTNAGIVVLGVGVWLLGLVALAREVFGARTVPVVLVPPLAATFVGYPTVQLTVLAQLAHGLSTALLPGALVLVLRAVRAWRAETVGRRLAATIAAAAATAGVVTAHASGLFALAVLGGPLIVGVALAGGVRWWRMGRRAVGAAVLAMVVAGVAAGPLIMTNLDALSAVVGFERASGYSHLQALREVLLDRTLVHSYPGDGWQHLPITLATLAGVVLAVFRRRHRWLAAGYVIAVVLAVLAAGPEDNPLRWLAGFWYTQAGRIAPIAIVPAVLLAAAALTALIERLHGLRAFTGVGERQAGLILSAVLAVTVLAVAVARVPLQERVVASAFVPSHLAFGTMATSAELDMMQRLGDELPDDAVVVGDPFNGSALLPAVAGVDVVFPQLGPSGMSKAQRTIQDGLHRLPDDPAVCEALTEAGATHLYQDTATGEEGAKTHERTAGMRAVDVNDGFELVDSAGTAGVYRIVGCGG